MRLDSIIEGCSVVKSLQTAIKALPPLMPGYGNVLYNPETKQVRFVTGDSDEPEVCDRWRTSLKVKGVDDVVYDAEYTPKEIGIRHKPNKPWIKVQ